MSNCKIRRSELAQEFKQCKDVFIALGDETRQQIVIALLESDGHGIRVGEITKKTHLSRPAVSHHLEILKNSGIINMHREGTKNYYYVNSNERQWKQLTYFINHIYSIIQEVSSNNHNKTNDCNHIESY